MKNKRLEAVIILFCGLIVLAFAWFIFAVYKPVGNTDSSRLEDLNSLINTIGKTPSTIIFALIGITICYLGISKWRK
ncbi:hypothetical protein ACQ33O_08540 [Ferruginibacter sp. SUN002]|uniref:hypothetical protein n=1 Tax=Ferruginibacter sp. SUN002 TaxID=2937789 RepID=UPI003D36B6F8